VSGKGLAVAAFVLGIAGLFTAGGLLVGSLLGLALAGAALARGSERSVREVAWAAVAANVLALATLVPLGAAALMVRASPVPIFEPDDDALPEPAQVPGGGAFVDPTPPPPPPPSSTLAERPASAEPVSVPPATPAAARPTPALPGEAPPVRVGDAIAEPRKTRHVNPVYPQQAIQARIQGVVILECTIDREGRVAEVRVLRGVPLLNEPAIEAVRQWEYEPTLLNGVAVPVRMTVTVNFKLS
jgi:TonB family protein